ncbi:MAG: TraR/DksA C4-type zinc finger protein [Anaerolineae bacterium]|nr:TraR/DksA C4-type zinc finger protein [Anaerolineae bacterium]
MCDLVTTTLTACLEQLTALHNHVCPRQVLGARIGLLAGELLGLDVPQRNKRLFAFVELDGCFSDGVAVASGCWLGHRTLRLVDFGKAAATFVDTNTGRAVRIWPNPESRERAAALRPDARDRWHAMLEAYQAMPVEDLLCSAEVALSVDLKAIISRPGVRVACARCGEEILNERERRLDGQIVCPACAGEAYYTLKEQCL